MKIDKVFNLRSNKKNYDRIEDLSDGVKLDKVEKGN